MRPNEIDTAKSKGTVSRDEERTLWDAVINTRSEHSTGDKASCLISLCTQCRVSVWKSSLFAVRFDGKCLSARYNAWMIYVLVMAGFIFGNGQDENKILKSPCFALTRVRTAVKRGCHGFPIWSYFISIILRNDWYNQNVLTARVHSLSMKWENSSLSHPYLSFTLRSIHPIPYLYLIYLCHSCFFLYHENNRNTNVGGNLLWIITNR